MGKCHLQPRGQHGYQSILPFEAQAESVSSKAELFNAQEHEQGLAFSDQAQSFSALSGQLSSMHERTMIYLHSFEILGPKMTEFREQIAWNKQASSRASFLCHAHWMSQRGQRGLLCVSSPETGIDLHCWDRFNQQDPSNMGCTMLIAPFAQQLFSRWREDAIFVSFHSLPAFPSHHFTFAALFPPGRSFKVGRKIDRLVWKERFPKASAPVPHHPPIQTALGTSSQSGPSLQTGSHWASSGPRVSTLLITKKEEKILQLIQSTPLQAFATQLLWLLELHSQTVWTGTSFRQRQQYSMISQTTRQKGKLRHSHGHNPPKFTKQTGSKRNSKVQYLTVKSSILH